MPLGVGSQLLVAAKTCYFTDRDNWIAFEIFNNRKGRRLGRWIPDGRTVAAVVLILFRQERWYKQPVERNHAPNGYRVQWFIQGYCPARGFCPGNCSGAAAQRMRTRRDPTTHPKQQERTWTIPRVYDITLPDQLSCAPFSNVNPAHTGCDGITNSEWTVNTGIRLRNHARKKRQWNDDNATRSFWFLRRETLASICGLVFIKWQKKK